MIFLKSTNPSALSISGSASTTIYGDIIRGTESYGSANLFASINRVNSQHSFPWINNTILAFNLHRLVV